MIKAHGGGGGGVGVKRRGISNFLWNNRFVDRDKYIFSTK